jgi:flagellar motility protein MotE (MotC chaperone)
MLPSKKKSCVRAGRAVKCNACGQKKKCLYLTGELSEDIPAACLTPIEANKENFPPTVAPPRKKKRKTDAHDHDADKLIELLQKKNDLLLQAIQTKQEDFALLLKEQEATKKLLVKTIREKVELSQELDAIKYPNKFRVNGDFGKPQEGDSGYPQGDSGYPQSGGPQGLLLHWWGGREGHST